MLRERLVFSSGLAVQFSSPDSTTSGDHATSVVLRNNHKEHFEKYNFENPPLQNLSITEEV